MSKRPLPENRRVAPRPKGASAPDEQPGADFDEAPKTKRAAKREDDAPKAPKAPSRFRERLAQVVSFARVALGVMVFAATAAAASYGLYRYVSTSSRFAIRHVTVEGAHQRTEAEVIRLGGLEPGKNIFSVDLEGARRGLLADPWIERATVTRKLPGTVHVTISEREPAAIVSLGDTLYLSAAGGEVFKRLEPGDPTDLVVVTGLGGEGELVRDRDGVRSLVRRAQDLAADYERLGAPKSFPLQEVHVTDEGGMSLVVGRDAVVLALGKGPYRTKLERALRVLSEIDRRKGQASIVFLDNEAHPERVVARMR